MSKKDKALLSDGFNHPTPDGQTIAYTVDDATPGSPIGSGFDQTSGKSYLNTLTTDFPSGTVGGVTNGHDPIDLSYHFKNSTGGQAKVSIDVSAQVFFVTQTQFYFSDASDQLVFKLDDEVVHTINGTELATNDFTTFEFLIDTGAPKSHHTLTIEHVDNGFGSPLGFAIDNLHVYDVI